MKFLLSTLCLGSAAAAVNPAFLQESAPAQAAPSPPSPVAVAAVPAPPAAPFPAAAPAAPTAAFPGAAPAAPTAAFPGAAPAAPAVPAVATPFTRVAPAPSFPAVASTPQQDEKELARAAKELEGEVARLKAQLEAMRREVASNEGEGRRVLRGHRLGAEEREARRTRADELRANAEQRRAEARERRDVEVAVEREHAEAIRAQAEELRAHAEELFIQEERARRGSEEARAQIEEAKRRMQEAHRGMLHLHGHGDGEHEMHVIAPRGEEARELRAFVRKMEGDGDAIEREIAILTERLGDGATVHRMRNIDDSDDVQVFYVDGQSGENGRIQRLDGGRGFRFRNVAPAPPVPSAPPVPPALFHGGPQGGTTIHINVEEGDVHIDASGANIHTSKGAKAKVKSKDLFGKADGELSFGIAVGGDAPDGPQRFAWTTKAGSKEAKSFFATGEFPEVVETIEVIEEDAPEDRVFRSHEEGRKFHRIQVADRPSKSKGPQVFSFSLTLDGDERAELTEALEEMVEDIEDELALHADTMKIESKIQIDGAGPFVQIWKNGEELDLDELENLQVFSAGLEGLEALKGLKDMNFELESLEALKGLEGLKALEGLENLPFDIDVDVDFDIDDVECILEEIECDIEEQECILEEEAETDERFVFLDGKGVRGDVIWKEAFSGDGETFGIAAAPKGDGVTYSRVVYEDPAANVAVASAPAASDAQLLELALEIQAELRAMRSELQALREELRGPRRSR